MRNQYMDRFISLQIQVNSLIAAQRADLKVHFDEQERIDLERVDMQLGERSAACEQLTK